MWDKLRTITRVYELEKQRRENPQSVLDLNPQGAVTWTEVLAFMKEDGWIGNAVDARLAWDRATRLVRWPR